MIWNSITLIVALNLLHDYFEMIIIPLLHLSNKDLEEILQIIPSTKVANMVKQVTIKTTNLAMMTKKRSDDQ